MSVVSNGSKIAIGSLLFVLAAPSGAASMVQSGPLSAPNTVETLRGTGLMTINPDGTPFTSAGGVTAMSKAQADDGTGVTKVFSSIDARGVAGIPDMQLGFALAQTEGQAYVAGAGSGPVDVTFQMAFDGAFHTYGGNVFHLLGATLTVAVPSTTVQFSNVEYTSAMDFRTVLVDADAINVSGKTTKSYYQPGFVYVVEDYAGASFSVVNQEMDLVAGMLSLTMSLVPGESFFFAANLFTQVSPEPLIPVVGGLDYSQSWGAVDAFNSGRIGIILPSGYSLQGDAAMFNVAVVPEPSTWAMFLAGMAVLAAGVRRRRRSAACPALS